VVVVAGKGQASLAPVANGFGFAIAFEG